MLCSQYWRGYMASQLDSGKLIVFALLTFTTAPWSIKYKLMEHLFTDPAGQYLINAYVKRYGGESKTAAGDAAQQ